MGVGTCTGGPGETQRRLRFGEGHWGVVREDGIFAGGGGGRHVFAGHIIVLAYEDESLTKCSITLAFC